MTMDLTVLEIVAMDIERKDSVLQRVGPSLGFVLHTIRPILNWIPSAISDQRKLLFSEIIPLISQDRI